MDRGTSHAGARGRLRRLAGPAVAVVVAFGAASVAASWVSDQALPKSDRLAATASPASRIGAAFFDLRFYAHEMRSAPSNAEARLANMLFAQKPTYENGSPAIQSEPVPAAESEPAPAVESESAQSEPSQTIASAVPLPRPRPAEAGSLPTDVVRNLENDRPEDPTLLEKLSGMFKYRLTLASLAPTDGIFAPKTNLAALGYDNETAVYDISAHVVYLPNGSKLEAHSGLGETRDDPAHVSEHQVGATPPAVYELKPREQLFHGVQALRMNPVEGSALGRTGLLVHPYMLGPDGDSNGCVSIRDYDRFLAAYQRGEFKRLAVIPNLAAVTRQSSL
jgi:hypothetical protein